MWTCHYRGTTHELAHEKLNITATCCSAGTLQDGGANCALTDRTTFVSCTSAPEYTAGVWTCESPTEWCTGQNSNERCTQIGGKGVVSNGSSRSVKCGKKAGVLAAVVLVAMAVLA